MRESYQMCCFLWWSSDSHKDLCFIMYSHSFSGCVLTSNINIHPEMNFHPKMKSSFTHQDVFPNLNSFFFLWNTKGQILKNFANRSFLWKYSVNFCGIKSDSKRMKKHHESKCGQYDSCTLFQFFSSHMIALLEEQVEF